MCPGRAGMCPGRDGMCSERAGMCPGMCSAARTGSVIPGRRRGCRRVAVGWEQWESSPTQPWQDGGNVPELQSLSSGHCQSLQGVSALLTAQQRALGSSQVLTLGGNFKSPNCAEGSLHTPQLLLAQPEPWDLQENLDGEDTAPWGVGTATKGHRGHQIHC